MAIGEVFGQLAGFGHFGSCCPGGFTLRPWPKAANCLPECDRWVRTPQFQQDARPGNEAADKAVMSSAPIGFGWWPRPRTAASRRGGFHGSHLFAVYRGLPR
jgi:hypothetical protein